jgi:integrase/recombinase XerD
MRLSVVVALHLSHKRALGYRFRAEEAVLRTFCKAVGDHPIATIEPGTVRAFLNGNGPVTEYWTKKYRVLSGLYRYALARGLAERVALPPGHPRADGARLRPLHLLP